MTISRISDEVEAPAATPSRLRRLSLETKTVATPIRFAWLHGCMMLVTSDTQAVLVAAQDSVDALRRHTANDHLLDRNECAERIHGASELIKDAQLF